MSLLSGKRINSMMKTIKKILIFFLFFSLFSSALAEEIKNQVLRVRLRDGVIIESGSKPSGAPGPSALFPSVSANMRIKEVGISGISGKMGGRTVHVAWESVLKEASMVDLLSPGLSPYRNGRIAIRKGNGVVSELTGATLLKYVGHDAPVKELVIYSYDGFNKSWREENLDIGRVESISILSEEKPVPAPVPVIEKPAPSAGKAKAMSLTVRFEPDIYEVAPIYQKKLKAVAESAKGRAGKGRIIHVTGHTDHNKDKKTSLEISRKRAEAVKNFLVKKAGVPSSSIKISYMGDKKPVSTNKTPEGRSRNRRVDVTVK